MVKSGMTFEQAATDVQALDERPDNETLLRLENTSKLVIADIRQDRAEQVKAEVGPQLGRDGHLARSEDERRRDHAGTKHAEPGSEL